MTQADEAQLELDSYYGELRTLTEHDPGYAFARLAALAARLIEMRAELYRTGQRTAQILCTREVEPLLDKLDFIFRALSRAQSTRQLDWDIAKGGT